MQAKDYNLDWGELFEYDETSPSGLIWKAPQYFKGTPNYKRVGTPAGSKGKGDKGYWSVGLCKHGVRSTYLIHRIIWVIHNASVHPDNDIDHRDGIRGNNLISNLRECSKSRNSRNSKKRLDNTTGVINISRHKTRTGDGFRACVIGLDGVKYRKFYSIDKFGENQAFQIACEWYNEKLEELNGAGYTERHGC